MKIRLTQTQYQGIQQHGQDTYPHECCGYLLGVDDYEAETRRVSEIMPMENEWASGQSEDGHGQHDRFVITPEQYLAADKAARSKGMDLIGCYHSHPDCEAVPSKFDIDHAWPNFSYIIVSIREGAAAEMRSWNLREDRSGCDEEELQTEEGE